MAGGSVGQRERTKRHAIRALCGMLLAALLVGSNAMPAAAAPPAGVLQTVGDFLSLGANTMRELQEAIKLASGEAKQLLQEKGGSGETAAPFLAAECGRSGRLLCA